MSNEKINVVCRDCGSDEVRRDADVAWNPESQQWELNAIYDAGWCCECDCQSLVDEKITDPNDH